MNVTLGQTVAPMTTERPALADIPADSDKDRWTIGEMSREFDTTPRALRFYEDRGLLAPVRDGMNRLYTPRDRARLTLVLRGKRVGLSLTDIKDILDLYDLGDGQRTQMRASLVKFSKQLDLLREQRADLDEAIDQLAHRIEWLETQLAKPQAPVEGAEAYDAMARRTLDGEDDTLGGAPAAVSR